MHRVLLSASVALLLGVAPAAARPFPDTIPLADGSQPEGIAVGKGTTFYVGSIPTGSVYRGNLRTGTIELLVDRDDRATIGLDVDHRRRIFVAGGPTGDGYVYDARTGDALAAYDFADGTTFINDVIVTRDAAWFTDSFSPFLYRVPIGPGGSLAETAQQVPLSGDYEHLAGFNLNGIDATPNGKTLIAVQSMNGALYAIDPDTGEASLIDLAGDAVVNGDGILLDGKTLYVVQNFFNQIAVVELAPDLGSGDVVAHITDPDFDIPTTIAEHGNALYAVNARFTTPPTPDTEYDVVRVSKR